MTYRCTATTRTADERACAPAHFCMRRSAMSSLADIVFLAVSVFFMLLAACAALGVSIALVSLILAGLILILVCIWISYRSMPSRQIPRFLPVSAE